MGNSLELEGYLTDITFLDQKVDGLFNQDFGIGKKIGKELKKIWRKNKKVLLIVAAAAVLIATNAIGVNQDKKSKPDRPLKKADANPPPPPETRPETPLLPNPSLVVNEAHHLGELPYSTQNFPDFLGFKGAQIPSNPDPNFLFERTIQPGTPSITQVLPASPPIVNGSALPEFSLNSSSHISQSNPQFFQVRQQTYGNFGGDASVIANTISLEPHHLLTNAQPPESLPFTSSAECLNSREWKQLLNLSLPSSTPLQAGLPSLKNTPIHFLGPIPQPPVQEPLIDIKQALRRVFDEDMVVRDAGLQKAEQLAKEIRYPYLVHSQDEMNTAQRDINQACEQFKSNLLGSLGIDNASQVLAAVVAGSAAVSGGPITSAVALLSLAVDTVIIEEDLRKKVLTYYKPLREAYQEIHKMESANRTASKELAEQENYQPKLIFHPQTPQISSNETMFLDLNNPKQMSFTVWTP